jgi:hypothetical protein
MYTCQAHKAIDLSGIQYRGNPQTTSSSMATASDIEGTIAALFP